MTIGELVRAMVSAKTPSGHPLDFDSEVHVQGDGAWFDIDDITVSGGSIYLNLDAVVIEKPDE
jgi:hypothetical protein